MLRCLAGLTLMACIAGCDADHRTPVQYTPSTDKLATIGNDTTPAPMPAVPGRHLTPPSPPRPSAKSALTFVPRPGSMLSGTGDARAAGRGTAIAVTLQQGYMGITYDGVLRRGGCESAGPAVTGLIPITTDSLGRGAAASAAAIPLDSLLEHQHVLIYGRGGRAETCAPLGVVNAAQADSVVIRRDTARRNDASR